MAQVAAGSVVRCQVTSTTTFTNGLEDIVAGASSILAQNSYGVQNASVVGGGFLNALSALGTDYPFQATMDIVVPSAFGDPSDVLSIVENAFYQETGAYPTSATWTQVTDSSGNVTQNSASSGLSPNGIGGAASDATTEIENAASSAATGLQNLVSSITKPIVGLGSNLLIGAAILLVIILAMVFFSPNTEKVGRAAAAFA